MEDILSFLEIPSFYNEIEGKVINFLQKNTIFTFEPIMHKCFGTMYFSHNIIYEYSIFSTNNFEFHMSRIPDKQSIEDNITIEKKTKDKFTTFFLVKKGKFSFWLKTITSFRKNGEVYIPFQKEDKIKCIKREHEIYKATFDFAKYGRLTVKLFCKYNSLIACRIKELDVLLILLRFFREEILTTNFIQNFKSLLLYTYDIVDRGVSVGKDRYLEGIKDSLQAIDTDLEEFLYKIVCT